jgi:SWI/SNF-related matrix-associated actin-dependent regulator of chromatin subfamily A member 5
VPCQVQQVRPSCEALPIAEHVLQAALNQKLEDFTANARQFTMDGGIIYDFKDEEDYKTCKKDFGHIKKAMASNWVEQPRQRKVRVNYNESEFLKATMKASKEEKVKGPRLTKMPQLNDFQFFNTQRIEELYAIEHAHETFKFQQHHRRLELEKANTTPEEIEAELNKCALRLLPVSCLSVSW